MSMEKKMEHEEDKEVSKIPDACQTVKKMEIYGDAHLKKYVNWENKSNFCWLDASMALVAHNKVMKRSAELSPKSRINKIIKTYEDAISDLNNPGKTPDHRKKLAREKLNGIQESTYQSLQDKLKYKTGDPESAFCSLYNLLLEDSIIKGIFDVTWISAKGCTNCGNNSESTKKKPVITLSKIDSFDPKNPAVLYNCTCNKSEQKIRLAYVSLPPCLIFHFESGAGDEKAPLSFIIREREYHLTGIMTLEKSQESNISHFITWVRDPSVDKWLDCNDLNPDEITFSPDFPDIKLEDVYIYVYESFDDLGTIQDREMVNVKKSEENIPCIDISEESDTENSNSLSNASRSNLDTKKLEEENTFKICNLNKQNSNLCSSESQTVENKISTIVENKLENAKITNKQNVKEMKEEEQNFSSSTTTVVKYIQNKALLPTEKPENSNLGDEKSTELKDLDSAKFGNLVSNDNVEQENLKKQNKYEQNPLNSDAEQNNNDQLIPNPYFQQQEKSDAFLSDVALTNKQNETEVEEEKQNISSSVTNMAKCIQNKALLPAENLKNSDVGDGKSTELTNLDCSKSGNLVSNNIVEENQRKQKSEKLSFNSNTEQNNDKFTSNSNAQQWEKSEAFLTDVASNNSGTSYVKMSFRRKKYPDVTLRKRYCFKNVRNQDSDESEADERNYSKSVKRNKVLKGKIDEDCDTVQNAGSKKRQKISQILNEQKHVVNEKEEMDYSKPEVLKKEPKKSSQDNSKLRNSVSKKKKTRYKNKISNFSVKEEECAEEHLQQFSNQFHSYSGMVSEAENSSINEGDEEKILKEFEDEWSCHKPDCNCELASIEETIDTVVDYTFAYLCKLSQGLKKSNSH